MYTSNSWSAWNKTFLSASDRRSFSQELFDACVQRQPEHTHKHTQQYTWLAPSAAFLPVFFPLSFPDLILSPQTNEQINKWIKYLQQDAALGENCPVIHNRLLLWELIRPPLCGGCVYFLVSVNVDRPVRSKQRAAEAAGLHNGMLKQHSRPGRACRRLSFAAGSP